MRRLALIFLCVLAMRCMVFARPVIPVDFYLNDGRIIDENETVVANILPNTLRLKLSPGEQTELFAEVLPEGAAVSELIWNGEGCRAIADIYPKGDRCIVIAVSEGEGSVRISAPGGAERIVGISIEKTPEISVRTFDYEGSIPPATGFASTAMTAIVRVLAVCGALMTVLSTAAALKRRKEIEG